MEGLAPTPVWRSTRIFSSLLALIFAIVLPACSSLPAQLPRTETLAITDHERTALANVVNEQLSSDGRSGFRLQPYGPNAFATRIELTKLATRSLDVQYYLLGNDNAGRALMRALRDASVRGVRVRLLIDDLYTAGEDELLLGLASYPNIEVRLFNPFPGGRGSLLTRFISSGLDLSRINRRMHNKLFVADNVAAVAGGRNMADEYVMNTEGSNFIDMDVFVAGPVVRRLSSEFDHYWNSDVVYPVEHIASDPRSPALLQRAFEELTASAEPPVAVFAPADGNFGTRTGGSPSVVALPLVPMLNLPFELASRKLSPLLLANARVLFDPLSKTAGANERQDTLSGTVTEGVIQWLQTARQQIKLVSPYFVPSDGAVASLIHARTEGVGVELITNSLASTDEPWVYVGYQAHISPLLRAGVEVWEISPSLSVRRSRMGVFGNRTGALHMKNAIVDHAQVFLGSMNLDQRSAKLNTELGLIIESRELAQQLDDFADAGSSYRLRLGSDGHSLQWIESNDDGTQTLHDTPPETTALRRFQLRLIGPFIPERQL